MRFFVSSALLCAALAAPVAAKDAVSVDANARIKAAPGPEAGVEEHLGARVPMDLVLENEKGDSVALGSLIDRPTVVSLVYYSCPSICRPLLDEVSRMLAKLQSMDMKPGVDYNVLTISFDDTDSPAGSARIKDEYYKQLPGGFPKAAWTFLTGDSASIHRFTESVGFHFKRAGEDFAHPTTLVILSPDGKITRYMYGSEYLPADLKLALLQAKKGETSPTIARFLQFCFSYDPEGQTLAVSATRIVGLSTVIGLLGLVIFLRVSGKRHKGEEKVG